jgi:hypothetical protein
VHSENQRGSILVLAGVGKNTLYPNDSLIRSTQSANYLALQRGDVVSRGDIVIEGVYIPRLSANGRSLAPLTSLNFEQKMYETDFALERHSSCQDKLYVTSWNRHGAATKLTMVANAAMECLVCIFPVLDQTVKFAELRVFFGLDQDPSLYLNLPAEWTDTLLASVQDCLDTCCPVGGDQGEHQIRVLHEIRAAKDHWGQEFFGLHTHFMLPVLQLFSIVAQCAAPVCTLRHVATCAGAGRMPSYWSKGRRTRLHGCNYNPFRYTNCRRQSLHGNWDRANSLWHTK